jgi:hypothetical protein
VPSASLADYPPSSSSNSGLAYGGNKDGEPVLNPSYASAFAF